MYKKIFILNQVYKYLLMEISDWTHFYYVAIALWNVMSKQNNFLAKEPLLHKILAAKSEEEKNKTQFSAIQFNSQSFDLFPFS